VPGRRQAATLLVLSLSTRTVCGLILFGHPQFPTLVAGNLIRESGWLRKCLLPLRQINDRRLAASARAERQMGGAPVPTDKLLEAFFGPAVEDPNGSFQRSLWIGPDASPYRDYLIGFTMPVLDRFAGALRRSSPARPDEECHWYLCFSLAIPAFMLAAAARFLAGCREACGAQIGFWVVNPLC
jgi:hypothetical protein